MRKIVCQNAQKRLFVYPEFDWLRANNSPFNVATVGTGSPTIFNDFVLYVEYFGCVGWIRCSLIQSMFANSNLASQFGAVLDMVTDRSATSMLLMQLSIMYPRLLFIFQLLIALDLSSHYMHIVASSKKGKNSHKEVDESTPFLMKLYYTNRLFLFSICGGNELFFIFLYGLKWWNNYFVMTMLVLSFPVFAFKQLMNVIQLVNASVQLAEQDADTGKKNG